MSEFVDVALDPRVGDVVVFPGGLLSYKVTVVAERVVNVMRTTVHRDEPYERTSYNTIPFEVWRDLISFAATVRPMNARSGFHTGT